MSKTLYGTALAGVAALFIGCGESEQEFKEYDKAAQSEGTHGGHSHAHEHGPHDGHIIELTTDHKYHGELCLDEGGKSMTFYVLGSDLKTAVLADSIEFEIEEGDEEKALPSTPNPLEGEPEGKASRFTIDSSSLGELKDLESVHGHVHVVIDGTEFEGGLSHDHDH